jgi:type IV pilus assembly protein PilC
MANYSYVAIDGEGLEKRGSLDVTTQYEALKRIKEMGLFPTKVLESRPAKNSRQHLKAAAVKSSRVRKVKGRALTLFTRQLATLMEAGLPLLRGLRILEEQEGDQRMRRVIASVSAAIENGASFAEAVSLQPRVFNSLYVNLVKAGEISGAMEVALQRVAEYLEKGQKIKGKVMSAMIYPCAVLAVACGVVALLMLYVLPSFQGLFQDMMSGAQFPAFTRFVMGISEMMRSHLVEVGLFSTGIVVAASCVLRTVWGRWVFDRAKLALPVFGPVLRKLAISRFSRTLGTLVSNGVPILQALTIVKETAGNLIVGQVVSTMHDRVKEGDPMAPTLKSSGVFPAMVAGMVDVGEQTGALPEMLLKVADNYDDEVDNAIHAMTSLLEPLMIVFLAVVVGSIVIAMFLPLIVMIQGDKPGGRGLPGD